MKAVYTKTTCAWHIRFVMMLALILFLTGVAGAQPRRGPGAGRDRPPEPALTPEIAIADGETTPVALNLRNANIDAVIKFISDNTGKPVLKDKKVSAALTISSPSKMQPYEALDLIYDALRLEGFAVIETDEVIQIVPAEDTAKYPIETFTGDLPDEVLRQKGRLIRKAIPLRNVRATKMKEYLDPLMGPYANVAADERTNKLIILDSVRNIERYEDLLAEWDIIGFDDMEVHVVRLEYADATVLQQILNETVVKAATGGRRQGEQTQDTGFVTAVADTRTNSVVIAAPRERIDSILDFVKRLDVPKPKEVDVHVVPIKYADAESIASAVTPLFRRRASQAEEDQVEIRATGRDNSLLIMASQDNYETIMKVIRTIDTEEAQKRETRKFELKYLDATDTAEELRNLYGEMQQSNRAWWMASSNDQEEVNIVPISRTNSIIVIAAPQEFKLIESLIEEIDHPVDVEEALPKIYRIKYAQATDIVKTLNQIFEQEDSGSSDPWAWWRDDSSKTESLIGRLTGQIRFSVDANTNSIIAVTNNRANYDVVDRLVEQLDTSIPELANTMIVTLQHADATKLSNSLNSLFGRPARPQGRQGGQGENRETEEETVSEPFTFWWGDDQRQADELPISNLIEQVRFVPDARTNTILVTTAAQNFDVIRSLVEDLDREEPQVLIRVRVLEVNRDRSDRVGLRWSPDGSIYTTEDLDNALMAGGGYEWSDTFSNGRGVISSSAEVDLLLQLLMRNLDAEIIISPLLYVSNNETGDIFVGENIPRLENSQFTAEGTRNDSFKYEDIGISMDITPKISATGQVVLKVNLTTSQTTGETRFGSDIVQKREYNTKLAVEDGETMVLGGIRLDTDQTILRRIPILGHLPLVGVLFRNTEITKSTTDLYAFITPEVITTTIEARKAKEEVERTIDESREKVRDKFPFIFE